MKIASNHRDTPPALNLIHSFIRVAHPHPHHFLRLISSQDPVFPRPVIHAHGSASCRELTGQQAEWDFPRNISLPEDKVRLVGRMTICLAVSLGQSRCQSSATWPQTMRLRRKFIFIMEIYEMLLNGSLKEEDKLGE